MGLLTQELEKLFCENCPSYAPKTERHGQTSKRHGQTPLIHHSKNHQIMPILFQQVTFQERRLLEFFQIFLRIFNAHSWPPKINKHKEGKNLKYNFFLFSQHFLKLYLYQLVKINKTMAHDFFHNYLCIFNTQKRPLTLKNVNQDKM